MRLQLSNAFGNGPVSMSSVHIAVASGTTATSAIDATTDLALTFGGSPSVTLAQGTALFSDPIDTTLTPLTNLAVTIRFDSAPTGVTGHPGSRTTSYLTAGDAVSAPSLASAATTAHWYYITGLDVIGDSSNAAVVTFGDSITDGRGSTTDANNRWPDVLAQRLHANGPTSKVAVLNQGIGGNTVLSGGLGPTGTARFDRDVLSQRGVKWVIVLEGVNDIGGATGQSVATNLIAAFGQMVDKAHAAGIKAYGMPILPIGGSSYDSTAHETARQTVNNWIRTSGKFDAVIDVEQVVRDPANVTRLLAAYDSGDHLHLSVAGYQAMASAIPLSLFTE